MMRSTHVLVAVILSLGFLSNGCGGGGPPAPDKKGPTLDSKNPKEREDAAQELEKQFGAPNEKK